MKYVLEMTEEQAQIAIAALDFYSRMMIGQFREVVTRCLTAEYENIDEYYESRDRAVYYLQKARNVIFPELPDSLGASYGVYHSRETIEAWHLLQAIRSCIAWERNPDGGWTVEYDRPIPHNGEPVPICTVKDGDLI